MNRNSIEPWAACALILAAASACATRGDVRQGDRGGDVSEYMPLAVGNSWTYERSSLGEKGEERVEIVREENGYFVDNRGNALTVDAYGLRDPKRYLLRHPVESGRDWNNVVSVSSVERYRILEANVKCTVPAGEFDRCVRVEARNRIDDAKTLVNEMTFAPGVGIVRIEVFLEANDRRTPQHAMALKSYEVAPRAAAR